jgi:hypothetical protein
MTHSLFENPGLEFRLQAELQTQRGADPPILQTGSQGYVTRKKRGDALDVLVNAKLEFEEVTEPTAVQLIRFELDNTV